MLTLLALSVALARDPVLDAVEATIDVLDLRVGDAAPAIPNRAYAKAERGEVVVGLEFVDGVAAAKGWGVAVLDAPVEAVWVALNDRAGFAERYHTVDVSVHLSGDERRSGRRTFQVMRVPLIADRYWVHEVRFGDALYRASSGRAWEMEARVVQVPLPPEVAPLAVGATPVPWSEGGWLLRPLEDGRTLVEYWMWTDPGGPIPARLASRVAATAIPSLMRHIESYAREIEGDLPPGYVRPDASGL